MITDVVVDPRFDLTTRSACIGCNRGRPAPKALLCMRCRTHLLTTLREISDGHDRLDPRPRAGSGGRGAPGFGSRSPARDEVLALTDRRGPAAPDSNLGEALSLLRAVSWWADQARDAGLMRPRMRSFVAGSSAVPAVGLPPRSVAGECLALAGIIDRLAAQWWVGEMIRTLDNAVYFLRRALDELEQTIPLGKCPRPTAEAREAYAAEVAEHGDVETALNSTLPRCEGEVHAKSWGRTAQCRRCRHRWEGEETLRHLGAQLGEAMLDLPSLARYLDVASQSTLRSWAMRDNWARERIGGRTLYRLADAQESWWRAWERLWPMHGPAVPTGWVRTDGGWLAPDLVVDGATT